MCLPQNVARIKPGNIYILKYELKLWDIFVYQNDEVKGWKKSFTSEDIRKQVLSGATGKTVNNYIFFSFSEAHFGHNY